MTRSIHKEDYLQVLWDVAIDLHGIFSPLLGSHHVKLIEDPHGNFVVARDGYSVAHELAYRARNPITQAILKAGDVQGQVFGTLVEETIVLACNLVLSGRDLLDQGLHPYNITKGFHAAQQHARSWLQARLQRVGPSVTDVHRVLGEFLAQRLSEDVSRHLSRLITPFLQSRVQKLVDGDNSHALATMGCVFARIVDDMNILIKPGGRILDSFLVDGCAISKEPVGWRTCIDRAVLGRMPGGRVALVS